MTDLHKDEITNADRAERCHDVLELYNDELDVVSNLIDLLADARHWCDARNKSFWDFDRVAHEHYLVERFGEKRRGQ